MVRNDRRRDPHVLPAQTITLFVLVFGSFGVGVVLWTITTLAYRFAGRMNDLPADSLKRVLGVIRGNIAWLPSMTWMLAFIIVAGLLVTLLIVKAKRQRAHRRTRVDRASAFMGIGRDIEPLTVPAVQATAARLGVTGSIGVPIGIHHYSGEPLLASWEDMMIAIWGPRTGKTTSLAVPAILDAPGAVIVTSNKRDIVDATRDPRSQYGAVWVFDPQRVAVEPPAWYWNPLSYVTDEERAAKLAQHFATGSRPVDARTDAYFDPAAQDLLAGLLLAAALDQRPITDVYRWLTRPTDTEAVTILERHGYDLTADQVAGVVNAPDKQRGGIFGTAQQMASCLTSRAVVKWIVKDPGDERPEFNPDAFVRGTDTLYSLSKEGPGTAGPLVTALTVAVVEAAEELAAVSPGGRLKTPLLGVLDEAANVCRWKNLPDLYSHLGSRGIILITILQSWSQGVEVWGQGGMKKLWSASNVASYGGGVKEDEFLESLSKLIGEHERVRTSVSSGKGHRSTSQQVQRERTMDVSELAALPKGRAVILASGSRATLIRTRPWMVGRHAAAVRASIKAHDPSAAQTLTVADTELADVTRAFAIANEGATL